MGLSFRKSFKIAPGVRVNVSKSGVGASFGGKGLRYSVNSRGHRRTTLYIPGSGLSYTSTSSRSGKSYKSSSYQRQNQLEKAKREQEKLAELERNKLEVELYENRIEMLKSIHKEADDFVNWNEIRDAAPPYNVGEIGPREIEALRELDNYKPGFFAKLFKTDEKKKIELQKKVDKAKVEDKDDYLEWRSLVQLATRIIDGDPEAYFEVIQEFSPLDDISEFGSGFEFIIEDSKIMEVEFDVQTNKVIPLESKTLTKTGKVSRKQISMSKLYDLQQDYVCSCAIRIARDMFALLPLKTVYVHATDYQTNSSTGHKEEVTILSVEFDREQLNTLNFESIDCSDSMTNFVHNMNFKKTKGLLGVDKLKPSNQDIF